MTRKTLAIFAITALSLSAAPAVGQENPGMEIVTIPIPDSPLVAIRLLFRTGSIHDPEGKEGLATLTGLMLGRAGTKQRPYGELLDALYPMAASIGVSTDREVTVMAGQVHRDKLDEYTALLTEALLQPAFSESDFNRNRDQLLAYLTDTLRASSDELLGLEVIQQAIFKGHPYGHAPAGTVEGLEAITLEDVKKFYQENYTRANLMLGLAGGYPDRFIASLKEILSALPEGAPETAELPQPQKIEGRSFLLVDKETDSVGIHIGFALPVTRADDDYYPLMIANSYLGEHRTSHGRLVQQLRMARGFNYGDYSYIEHWANPPFTFHPSPNVPRRQQYFSVWIRPVVPETAHFALRNALYELRQFTEQGMSQEDFDLTRTYLINYSKLWAQSLSRRLGYLMDSRFYGMDYYIGAIEEKLAQLTLEDVNKAVKKYLQADNYSAVFVTADAETVKTYLEKDDPSPITYNSQVGEAVLEADKTIHKLPVRPTSVEIFPVQEVFQR
jgi:zinc protease